MMPPNADSNSEGRAYLKTPSFCDDPELTYSNDFSSTSEGRDRSQLEP